MLCKEKAELIYHILSGYRFLTGPKYNTSCDRLGT